jgi:hypothetical protein
VADIPYSEWIKLQHTVFGNGVEGLVQIARDQEQRLAAVEAHHMKESQIIYSAVKSAMDERAKSTEGKIRAFAPYFSAIFGLVGGVVIALITKQA